MTRKEVARRIHLAVSALSDIGSSGTVGVHCSIEAVAVVAAIDGAELEIVTDVLPKPYLVSKATVCGVEVTAFGPNGITELPAEPVANMLAGGTLSDTKGAAQ